MEIKKKNKFLTFCTSMIPGGAQMYMGLMKNGASMLGIVLLLSMLIAWSGLELLLAPVFLVWVYSFFHAWNLVALSEENLAKYEDKYVWEEFATDKKINIPQEVLRKWVAWACIVFGVAMVWRYVSGILYRFIPDGYWSDFYMVVDKFPSFVLGIIIVVVGYKLIVGKKKAIDEETEEA
ncbi:MAG: hypothetical protein IKZ97_02195 [Butyrivibrio sp.]|nr:hypothetical protein [Butyrivibrio sp.]